MKNKNKLVVLLPILILLTGCQLFKRDSMENISITTSNFALEYTTRYLYGENSLVTSILSLLITLFPFISLGTLGIDNPPITSGQILIIS